MPYTFRMPPSTQILVRSQVPPLTLLHAVQEHRHGEPVNSRPTARTKTWTHGSAIGRSGSRNTWSRGFSDLAGLALGLSAVGLYSVVSYTVTQRTNEFGIRVALGAEPRHIMLRFVFLSTFRGASAAEFSLVWHSPWS